MIYVQHVQDVWHFFLLLPLYKFLILYFILLHVRTMEKEADTLDISDTNLQHSVKKDTDMLDNGSDRMGNDEDIC